MQVRNTTLLTGTRHGAGTSAVGPVDRPEIPLGTRTGTVTGSPPGGRSVILGGAAPGDCAEPGTGSPNFPRSRLKRMAEAGMTTAEYAVGTIAACCFGSVLYKIVTSARVEAALTGLVERALSVSF